jgi:preprotein translocase SecE subunit
MDSNQNDQKISRPSLRRAYETWENAKAEFRKIQWTEGEEVWIYAKVVVVATFGLGFSIFACDLFVRRLLVGIDVLFRLIFG